MRTFLLGVALALCGCSVESSDSGGEQQGELQSELADPNGVESSALACTFSNCISECLCYKRLCIAEADGSDCNAEFNACKMSCPKPPPPSIEVAHARGPDGGSS